MILLNAPRRKRARSQFVPVVERLEARLALSTFGGGFEPRHDFRNHGDFDLPSHHRAGVRLPRPEEYRFERQVYPSLSPPSPVAYIQVTAPPAPIVAPTPAMNLTSRSAVGVVHTVFAPASAFNVGGPLSVRLASSERQPRIVLPSLSIGAIDEILSTNSSFATSFDTTSRQSGNETDASGKGLSRNSQMQIAGQYRLQTVEPVEQRKRLRWDMGENDEKSMSDELLELDPLSRGELATVSDAQFTERAEAVTNSHSFQPSLDWLSLQSITLNSQPRDEITREWKADSCDGLIDLLVMNSKLPQLDFVAFTESNDEIAIAHFRALKFEASLGRVQEFEMLFFDEPVSPSPIPAEAVVAFAHDGIDDKSISE